MHGQPNAMERRFRTGADLLSKFRYPLRHIYHINNRFGKEPKDNSLDYMNEMIILIATIKWKLVFHHQSASITRKS